MPYIDAHSRQRVDEKGVYVLPGDLAYKVSAVIEEYRQQKGDKYATFSDVLGALETAKSEFQRKVINPYEDKKLVRNGPVHAATSAADVPRRYAAERHADEGETGTLAGAACPTGNCN